MGLVPRPGRSDIPGGASIRCTSSIWIGCKQRNRNALTCEGEAGQEEAQKSEGIAWTGSGSRSKGRAKKRSARAMNRVVVNRRGVDLRGSETTGNGMDWFRGEWQRKRIAVC